MKKNVSSLLFVAFLITLCSCGSVKKFAIEIQEPALITLPVSTQNVLILNNTVPQPINYGIEQSLDSKPLEQAPAISLDSAPLVTIQTLSKLMVASDFYNEVSIYKDSIRSDGEWLSVSWLPKEIQDEFYDENYDALITIDRLLYLIKENVKKPKIAGDVSEVVFVDARVDAVLTCSIYLYGKDSPYKTISISDSLFFKTSVFNDSAAIFKELPEYLTNELAIFLGEKAATYFIPTWKAVDRMIYTDSRARMKEAYSYATGGQKWAKAESIWQIEFENRSKSIDKAWIALNLAVANEMQDQFESAIGWAEKAKQLFAESNPAQYSNEITFSGQYSLELQKRIQYNRLLNAQWGTEESH
jgi:hypothetical protein